MELKSIQKLLHVSSLPHETSGWVLYGEQDAMLDAESTKLLRQIIQLVGSLHTLLIDGT